MAKRRSAFGALLRLGVGTGMAVAGIAAVGAYLGLRDWVKNDSAQELKANFGGGSLCIRKGGAGMYTLELDTGAACRPIPVKADDDAEPIIELKLDAEDAQAETGAAPEAGADGGRAADEA